MLLSRRIAGRIIPNETDLLITNYRLHLAQRYSSL